MGNNIQIFDKTTRQIMQKQLIKVFEGTDDPRQTRDLIKYSNSLINGARAIIDNERAGIQRERLEFDREKFEYKKEQNIRKNPLIDTQTEKDSGYWEDVYNIKLLIRQYVQGEYPDNIEKQKVMPTEAELEKTPEYRLLADAINKYHGGFKKVADLLGYKH